MGGTGGDLPVTNLLFRRGPVGVLSRSGGMGSETCWLLTREGIGQSTYVSVGGDAIVGAPFSELMPLFEADPDTECVVLFGEPGSCAEEDAARLLGEGGFTKPVVAFIAGMVNESAPQGVSFGHAAAIIERGEGSPARKKAMLKEAGVACGGGHARDPGRRTRCAWGWIFSPLADKPMRDFPGMKALVRRSPKPSSRVDPEGRIEGTNPTDDGVVRKTPGESRSLA